jgi:glycosyltransferase involved in cell wall biosynthesis
LTPTSKPKLAVLTHMISPHTAPMYRGLSNRFDVRVLVSGHQDNRTWNLDHLGRDLDVRRAFGFTWKWTQRTSGRAVWEERYTHFNPGYFSELVRFRPDMIFSHEMGFRTVAAIIYAKIFRTPLWVFWEGPMHTERRISWVKRVLRRIFFVPLIPRWVTCGESSTEYLTSLGIDRDRIVTAQNPVDEEPYRTSGDSYPLEQPGPVVLCVSRLTGLKAIDRLLEVASDLQHEGHEFSLVIVGEGPERDRLLKQERDLGLERVQWIPRIPLEEMASIYRSADLLVFPTLSDVWGLVVNEALWTGTPVIASKYAGAALDLLPERNIFDPLDRDDFRDVFRRALNHDIAGPEESPLLTAVEVADVIADDMEAASRGKQTTPTLA